MRNPWTNPLIIIWKKRGTEMTYCIVRNLNQKADIRGDRNFAPCVGYKQQR